MYSITVWHEALGKYQVVRGRTPAEAQLKADLKKSAWDAQYARSVARTQRSKSAADKRAEREALKEEAADRTEEAEQAIDSLGDVLSSIVNASPVFEIAKQKIVAPFSERPPQAPRYLEYPSAPKREEPQFGILDNMFSFLRRKKVEQAEDAYLKAYGQWSDKTVSIKKANDDLYQTQQRLMADWTAKKAAWEENRDKANAELDAFVAGLKNGNADSVYPGFRIDFSPTS